MATFEALSCIAKKNRARRERRSSMACTVLKSPLFHDCDTNPVATFLERSIDGELRCRQRRVRSNLDPTPAAFVKGRSCLQFSNFSQAAIDAPTYKSDGHNKAGSP